MTVATPRESARSSIRGISQTHCVEFSILNTKKTDGHVLLCYQDDSRRPSGVGSFNDSHFRHLLKFLLLKCAGGRSGSVRGLVNRAYVRRVELQPMIVRVCSA